MRHFYPAFFAASLAVYCAACSPKLIPLTTDTASAALPVGTSYALVNFYRPSKLVGFLIGYDVHLGDSVKYRAKDGSCGDVRWVTSGPVTVWAKTEAREEITLPVQPGREYFVRCTLGRALWWDARTCSR